MRTITTVAITLAALLLGTAVYQGMYTSKMEADVNPDVIAKFNQWSLEQKRLYSTPSEQNLRLLTFKKNLEIIEAINSSQNNYRAGLNQFSDLSKEEFVAKYLMKTRPSDLSSKYQLEEFDASSLTQTPPESYDLRSVVPATKLPPVKNQKSCGSCYAFAATTSIEFALALSKDPNHQYYGPLSPQEFVDCSGVSTNMLKFLIDRMATTDATEEPRSTALTTQNNTV